MLLFFMTLAVLLLIIAAMSVGVLMGRKPISGSCGGVAAALGEKDYVCDICGGDPQKCEESSATVDKPATGKPLFHNADRPG